MGKWLIDEHVHLIGCSPSVKDISDKIKTREDTISFNSRFPELYRARLTEEPIDTVDDYIKAMDRHGITHAIIQQDVGKGTNDMVAEAVKKHPDRFFGLIGFFGWDQPRDRRPHIPTEKELAATRARAVKEVVRGVEELGLIGVSEFWPRSFTFEVHPEKIARDMQPVMDVIAKYQIPIQIPTTWTQFPHNLHYGDPVWTDEIAYSYPEVPVILTKMGRGLHHFETALYVAIRNTNVYFDIVDSQPHHIRRAVDTIGAERIMFGCDWCSTCRWVTVPSDTHTKHKKLLDDANLSPSEREQIEWKTAAKVFRLNLQ